MWNVRFLSKSDGRRKVRHRITFQERMNLGYPWLLPSSGLVEMEKKLTGWRWKKKARICSITVQKLWCRNKTLPHSTGDRRGRVLQGGTSCWNASLRDEPGRCQMAVSQFKPGQHPLYKDSLLPRLLSLNVCLPMRKVSLWTGFWYLDVGKGGFVFRTL